MIYSPIIQSSQFLSHPLVHYILDQFNDNIIQIRICNALKGIFQYINRVEIHFMHSNGYKIFVH
jgi:hypothetical protein